MIKFAHGKEEGAYSASAQAWVCLILAEFQGDKTSSMWWQQLSGEKNLVFRISPTIFLLVCLALWNTSNW